MTATDHEWTAATHDTTGTSHDKIAALHERPGTCHDTTAISTGAHRAFHESTRASNEEPEDASRRTGVDKHAPPPDSPACSA